VDLANRHPSVVAVAKHFAFDHLPPHLQAVSKPCHDLAEQMIDALPDDPELVFGLRQLLLAKDAFVRTAVNA
jgi:hypothetical protein